MHLLALWSRCSQSLRCQIVLERTTAVPQVSDLVIILNQRRAIDAFTKGGNLTLGGNCTVAVGPVGR